jgi:CheY-like chemotaxis protein
VQLEIRCSDPKQSPFTMEIRVSDSGIGIRDEEISKLFESFSQVDQVKNYGTEGTGLGLALVKGYSTLMNGDVRVESVYGEGSTFIATVEQTVVDATPLDIKLVASRNVRDEFSLGTMHVHGVRALVVDDNPVNRKVISRSMGYYGLSVDVAEGGPESVAMCKNEKYDLVFMDQMMPEMNGIEAMNQIRGLNDYYARSNRCKIIVLTANAISGAREELLAEGFDEYLSKPVNFRALEALLVKFLPADVFDDAPENPAAEPDTGTAENTVKSETLTESMLAELLPGVDIAEGIHHCGETVDDYLEILELMYEASGQQLSELQKHCADACWKDFTICAHALKGSCLNIGAAACGASARELEMAGRAEDGNFIVSHLGNFIEEYRALLAKIRDVLVSQGRLCETEDALAYCSKLLEEMKSALRELDFARAGSLLEKAHSAPDANDYGELLGQLDARMDDMDADGMLEVLEN